MCAQRDFARPQPFESLFRNDVVRGVNEILLLCLAPLRVALFLMRAMHARKVSPMPFAVKGRSATRQADKAHVRRRRMGLIQIAGALGARCLK